MPSEYVYNQTGTFVANAAGVGPTDLVVNVTDASLFTFPLPTRLVCDDEIMMLTAVVGNVFTVTRGLEGSVAAAHVQNTPITTVITAGGLYAVFTALP